MNRFFVPQEWIADDRVHLDEPFAHQICHVLRLQPQDLVVVLDNTGAEYEVRLTEVNKTRVIGCIQETRTCAAEPSVRVTLFQSMLKRDKFEWVLQKCTELGVARIVPVVTSRSLVQKTEIKPAKMARWRHIIREAAEQCARGRVPDLAEPIHLAETFKLPFNTRLMATVDKDLDSIDQCLSHVTVETSHDIGLWIGPEGGYDPDEVALAKREGISCVGLGQRTLRTETAAIVGCTLILHALKEL